MGSESIQDLHDSLIRDSAVPTDQDSGIFKVLTGLKNFLRQIFQIHLSFVHKNVPRPSNGYLNILVPFQHGTFGLWQGQGNPVVNRHGKHGVNKKDKQRKHQVHQGGHFKPRAPALKVFDLDHDAASPLEAKVFSKDRFSLIRERILAFFSISLAASFTLETK